MSKHAGGRPSKFNSVEELQEAIDKYFDEAKPERCVDNNGETYVIFDAPTITGLAYALGFESRQSMYDYEKNDKYSYTIKRARLRIASQYERNLSNPKVPAGGSIFALKNIDDWKDKQDVSVDGGVNIVYAKDEDKEL